MKITKLMIVFLLLGLIVFTGCNKLTTKNPILNDPNANLNLKDYKAQTPEAQAIIDKMVRGEEVGRVLNGGATPQLMNSLKASQWGGTFTAEGMPSVEPNSAATRPKITLVMKAGGPAESYTLNAKSPGDSNFIYQYTVPSLEFSSVSVKTWTNSRVWYRYSTILFQDYSDDNHQVSVHFGGFDGQWSSYYDYDMVTIDTFDDGYSSVSIGYITVSRRYNSDTSYVYQNIPGNVFEDPNGAPQQETWYWNPPWHFDRVNFMIANNGSITYDAITRPGAEQQMLIFRWAYQDFDAAYNSTGGWKSQGWRIRDIDVENGVVCALLTPGTYAEQLMLYQTDDFVNSVIQAKWGAGYRGVVVDSSW